MKQHLANLIHLLVRLFLAACLGAAGWRHLAEGIRSGNQFMESRPGWWPEAGWTPYHLGLPFVELAAGGLLLVGLLGRTSALVASLVFLVLAVCEFSPEKPLQADFLLACLLVSFSWLLALHGPGPWSVDAKLAGKSQATRTES